MREGAEGAHAASAAPSSAIASTCTVLAMGSAPESAAYCSALYAGAPVAAEAMRRVSWRLVRERVCGQPIRRQAIDYSEPVHTGAPSVLRKAWKGSLGTRKWWWQSTIRAGSVITDIGA